MKLLHYSQLDKLTKSIATMTFQLLYMFFYKVLVNFLFHGIVLVIYIKRDVRKLYCKKIESR